MPGGKAAAVVSNSSESFIRIPVSSSNCGGIKEIECAHDFVGGVGVGVETRPVDA